MCISGRVLLRLEEGIKIPEAAATTRLLSANFTLYIMSNCSVLLMQGNVCFMVTAMVTACQNAEQQDMFSVMLCARWCCKLCA